jgi:O-antigen/teichoic acid export membrane protein
MLLRRLVRDYAALAGSEVLSKVAGFVAFAYLARMLGPGDYGVVEFTVAVHTVGFLVVDFGLAPIGARAITKDPSLAVILGREIPALRLMLSVVAYASMLLCTVAIGRSDALALVAIYGVSLFASPWKLNWLLQGLDRIRFVGPAQMIYMGVFAVGVVIFVKSPGDILRVGFAEVGAAIVMAGYFVLIGRRHVRDLRPRFDPAALRRLFLEAAPVGASQLMWAVNQLGPTLLVASLLGSDDIAFFGAAHRIVFSLGSFVFLYFFNIYPSLVRATETGGGSFERSIGYSFRLTTWSGALVALLGTLLAIPITSLVYGDQFGPTGELLGSLIWVLPLALASGHARFSLIASGYQRLEFYAQSLGAAITIALCLLLVPRLGIQGAAIAMLISALVVWAAAHYAFTQNVSKLPSLGPLARPAVALVAAWGVAGWTEASSHWTAAIAPTGAFLVVGGLLEIPFLRDLARLRARDDHA